MASKNQDKCTKKKKEFTWTDDEAELLLNVTHEYKIKQLTDGTCWESVRSKYGDILEMYKKELPNSEEEARATLKDYRHRGDQITKQILTAKLKAIRTNYRKVCVIKCKIKHIISKIIINSVLQAVNSGRRSGHGRVVYLYYDLCAKIWGRSPATEQLSTGLESNDLCLEDGKETRDSNNRQQGADDASNNLQQGADEASNNLRQGADEASNNLQQGADDEASNNLRQGADEASDLQEVGDSSSNSDSSSEQQSPDNDSQSSSGRQTGDESIHELSTITKRKRRGEQYKDEKLKKRVGADAQLVHLAEKEIQLKEKMIERMDTMSKDHIETITVLTNNLKTLSDTMANAFALLQQSSNFGPLNHPMSSFHGSPGFGQYNQYSMQSHSMPPSPSSVYRQPAYMPSQQAFFQQHSMSPDPAPGSPDE